MDYLTFILLLDFNREKEIALGMTLETYPLSSIRSSIEALCLSLASSTILTTFLGFSPLFSNTPFDVFLERRMQFFLVRVLEGALDLSSQTLLMADSIC